MTQMTPERLGTAIWSPPALVERELPFAVGEMWMGRTMTAQELPAGFIDDRHVCLVSGSRAGKGTSTIIPNLCLWPGSAIIVDPKGENATVTAPRRADGSEFCDGMGQKVHVLDPFGAARIDETLRSRFNPLDAIDPDSDHAADDVGRIADAIVVQNPESKDPYWEESARSMLKGLLLQVLTAPEFEGERTLISVRKLITHGDWKRVERLEAQGEENIPNAHALLWEGVARSESFDGIVSGIGRTFRALALDHPKQHESILQTLGRNTEFIDSPGMRRCLEASDFELGALKTDPDGVSLYLSLPQRYMNTHFRWLRMVIALAVNELEAIPGPPASGHPVLMCLDEFAGLKRMESIENAVAQMAGFGLKMFFVLQSLEQLKATYGNSWETFLANSGLKIFYGLEDHFSREYVSKLIGDTEVLRETYTRGESETESESHSRSTSFSRSAGRSASRASSRNRGGSRSVSDSRGQSRSSTQGASWSENRGQSQSAGDNWSQGENSGQGGSQGRSQGRSQSWGLFFPGGSSDSQGSNSGSSWNRGRSSGRGGSRTRGTSMGRGRGGSRSDGMSSSFTRGRTTGQSWGESTSETRGTNESETRGENEGHTRGTSRTISKGVNEALHKRALIAPDEIGFLFARQDNPDHPAFPGLSLALISGRRPVVTKRINYFDDQFFVRKFHPHPDYPFLPSSDEEETPSTADLMIPPVRLIEAVVGKVNQDALFAHFYAWPDISSKVERGDVMMTVGEGIDAAPVFAPVSGRVVDRAIDHPDPLAAPMLISIRSGRGEIAEPVVLHREAYRALMRRFASPFPIVMALVFLGFSGFMLGWAREESAFGLYALAALLALPLFYLGPMALRRLADWPATAPWLVGPLAWRKRAR